MIWFLFCQSFRRGQTNSSGLRILQGCFQRTTMVPWRPWCLWNWTICLNGKSQMMSLFRTKKGSWSCVRRSLAKARGPAKITKHGESQSLIQFPPVNHILYAADFCKWIAIIYFKPTFFFGCSMMYQRLWYIILISVYPVLLTRPFAYVFAIKYAQTNQR